MEYLLPQPPQPHIVKRSWMDRIRATVPPPGPNSVGCAKCCVVFASSGVLFLCLVGQLLTTQPIYITGVDSPKVAAASCFSAAWIYISVVVVSVFVLVYDKANSRYALHENTRSTAAQYGSTL